MRRKTDNRTLKEAILIYGGSTLIVILAFVLTFQFVKPAPPKTIRMATGTANNMYHAFGLQYQQALKKQGINVDLLVTQGSVDNLRLLDEGKADIALVQSGMDSNQNPGFEAIGSLYYEPLWLFTRSAISIAQLSELQGKRISIGSVGSGTVPVAKTLLFDNKINETNSDLLNLNSEEAVTALQKGTIDAVFMVTGPQSPYVQKLLYSPEAQLFNFKRNEAYHRLHPFLSAVTLPEGVIDITRNIPSADIHLLAPTATLVVTEDFHPALTTLMLQAASSLHGHGSILAPAGLFPSQQFIDFPLNDDAKRFYKSGPPFLQRYMPFWAANLVDRMIVLLLPLITLMIPLMKILPPTYRWRIRSRIYRWYDQLRDIEYRSESLDSDKDKEGLLKELLTIEKELMMTDIPKSYAESQYNLRLHIRLIRERLEWQPK